MNDTNQIQTAKHPGFCYLCGQAIYVKDEIQTWTVESNPVAAHRQCVEDNMAGGREEAK